MASAIEGLLQRRSLRAGVRRALDSGIGFYRTTWHVKNIAGTDVSERLAGELIAWCREMLSRTHRPYGLDSATLALAVAGEDGRWLARVSYGPFRPVELYHPGSIEAQAQATLQRWAGDGVFHSHAIPSLSAVLFSWGDLTWELLLTA
jgi:anti-sigma factor RsiW